MNTYNFKLPRYERRVFYQSFVHTNEMVDYMNHKRIDKRSVISIYNEDRFIVLIYEKIVEVESD